MSPEFRSKVSPEFRRARLITEDQDILPDFKRRKETGEIIEHNPFGMRREGESDEAYKIRLENKDDDAPGWAHSETLHL